MICKSTIQNQPILTVFSGSELNRYLMMQTIKPLIPLTTYCRTLFCFKPCNKIRRVFMVAPSRKTGDTKNVWTKSSLLSNENDIWNEKSRFILWIWLIKRICRYLDAKGLIRREEFSFKLVLNLESESLLYHPFLLASSSASPCHLVLPLRCHAIQCKSNSPAFWWMDSKRRSTSSCCRSSACFCCACFSFWIIEESCIRVMLCSCVVVSKISFIPCNYRLLSLS